MDERGRPDTGRSKWRNTGYFINILFLCTLILIALLICSILFLRVRRLQRALRSITEAGEEGSLYENAEPIYTQMELDRAVMQARAYEKRSVLLQIQSSLESGNSTVTMLRELFPETVVVMNDGRYYFYPLQGKLLLNSFSKGQLREGAGGKIVYTGTDQGVEISYGAAISGSCGEIDWEMTAEDQLSFVMVYAGKLSYVKKDAEAEGSGEGDEADTEIGDSTDDTEAEDSAGGESADAADSNRNDTADGEKVIAFETDPMARGYLDGAAQSNLRTGLYVDLNAVSVEEALEEARAVLSLVPAQSPDDFVVAARIDVPGSDSRQAGMSRSELSECAAAFCGAVREAGYTPVLCGSPAAFVIMLELSEFEDCDKWLTGTTDPSLYPYHFTYWEYSVGGQLSGFEKEPRMLIKVEDRD